MVEAGEEVAGLLALRVVEELLGRPCSTTWPSARNTMRSATRRAKPISWVAIRIVEPLTFRSRTRSTTSPASTGSSALVISSRGRSFGSVASARTMTTRCC